MKMYLTDHFSRCYRLGADKFDAMPRQIILRSEKKEDVAEEDLNDRNQRIYWVIQHIYEQQAQMYNEHTHGYARINTLSWEAYNEGTDLKKQVEAYKKLNGCYPEVGSLLYSL